MFYFLTMKKILIIPLQYYPIPAIKGGSIETLVTSIIQENEKNCRAKLFVISKNDDDAKKIKFKNSEVVYFTKRKIDLACYYIKKFTRKLIFNRFTKKFLLNVKYGFRELYFFGYKCNKIAKKIKPDIIVIESYHGIHRLWPLSKTFGCENIFYHLHNYKEDTLCVRNIFPNTIAVSKFVLDVWTKDQNIEGKNYVLYNGVDLERFNNKRTRDQIISAKSDLGFQSDDFIILFTGRLRPHKGVLELLSAFNKIKNKKIKLIVIGAFLSESKEHDIDEREFENNCLSIISSNSNIIRIGKVDYDKIDLFYHISDIQVVPSLIKEGFGLTALEGMASGLPLIVTNSGGMIECTGDECALILENNKDTLSGNLYNSIIKLYNNPELRNNMSKAGIERSKLFSSKNFYKSFMDIILGQER